MKDIKGYEGLYAVTSCGRIWSYRSKKFLKPKLMWNGYLRVDLRLNGGHNYRYIHRLVAETYLSNSDNLPQVNHKDEIKTHNWLSNLEWCSGKYNSCYSNAKKVQCIETGEIFNSVTDAANSINRGVNTLSTCLNGRTKTCAGLHWTYIE